MSETTFPAASTAQRYVVSPPCVGRVPAEAPVAARRGSMRPARSRAYAFDSNASIGVGELLRFDQRVQVVGRAASVVADRESLEDVQHDERRDPLAVRRDLVHV